MDNKVNDYIQAAFTLTDTFLDDLLANFKSNKKTRYFLLGQLAVDIPQNAKYSLEDRNELIKNLVKRLEDRALNQWF